MNGAERLCLLLYGRMPEIGDTIGGFDSQIMNTAADVLEALSAAAIEEGAVVCIPVADWTAAWQAVGR